MMKKLDCHTSKGRQWIRKQQEVAERIAERFGYQVIHTPDTDAKVDCLFVKDETIVGVAEIKSRDMSLQELKNFGSYLVTEEKLLAGIEIATYLRVPFALILNLRDADVFIKVCDSEGIRLAVWKSMISRTQKTCNGGEADRLNAYVSLSTMLVFR